MAANYTDDDWADLIADVEKSLRILEDSHPVPALSSEEFAKCIDHTLLKLDATESQIDVLCEEAKTNDFACVCVRLPFVQRCVANLDGSSNAVACTVGFHEGTQSEDDKVSEALTAVSKGAVELDVVLPHHLIHSSAGESVRPQYTQVFRELDSLRVAAPHPVTLKVILETSQLSHSQLVAASVLALVAGADMIKTSTGFCGRGASADDVRTMRAVIHNAALREKYGWVRDKLPGIKASGGIRTLEDAVSMMAAGATRIGTSSGVAIVREGRKSDVESGADTQ